MNAALLREKFSEIAASLQGWATIDQIVDACNAAGFWSDDFLTDAEDAAKKSAARKLMKTLRAGGSPEWASIVTTDEEGDEQRIYKQETLFDVEDYRQVVRYHVDRAKYHRETAQAYADRCEAKFDVQLRLPFDDRIQPVGKPR